MIAYLDDVNDDETPDFNKIPTKVSNFS